MKNNKIYPLIIVLLILFHNSICQVTYKKFYNTAGVSYGKFVKFISEQSANEFTVMGQFGDKSLINIKTDNTGDTTAVKFFKINSSVVIGGGIPFDISYSSLNQEYYIAYSDLTLNPTFPGDILILDTAFNIISQKAYHAFGSVGNIVTSVISTLNRELIICGGVRFNGSPFTSGTLFKTDSIGNLIWNKSYNIQTNKSFGFSSMLPLNDNSFLLFSNIDSLGIVISKLDSIGNPIWCKSWFRPYGQIEKMIQNPDGTIMVLGHIDNYNGISPLYLMKIDTSGSVTWCKEYGNYNNSNFGGYKHASLAPTADGGYIAAANFVSSSTGIVSLDIALLKLDQNGDTLWTRIHGSDAADLAGEIIQTSDGGYFAAGHTLGRVDGGITIPYGGYYLIKTDSLGYSGCQEWNYPLPVTTIFPADSNIILTMVQDSVIQDTANMLPDPIGYFKIYDGCLVTNVPEQHSTTHRVRIVPNPTKGIINITASEMPKPKDYITVYDSVGKIVLQRPYRQENQEMDLSHFSKGMYTIKVVQEGKVSVSKVVVE